MDDSGSGHGKVAVLAGFLSTPDRWKQFSEELEDLCEQEPKTPDFRMVKATGFRKYWPATREALDKRIQDVAALILKHVTYRIDVVVGRDAYEFIAKGKVPPEIDDPYFLLFCNVILAVAQFMDKMKLAGTVDFVFDEQGKIGRTARSLYYAVKKYARPEMRQRMGQEPVFKHDRDLLPLKAADLLAWQLRRHWDVEQPLGIAHNEIVDQIVGRVPGVSCHIRPEDLQLFVANIHGGLVFRSACVRHIP